MDQTKGETLAMQLCRDNHITFGQMQMFAAGIKHIAYSEPDSRAIADIGQLAHKEAQQLMELDPDAPNYS